VGKPPQKPPVRAVDAPPEDFAHVPPRDLHPVADIRLVITDVAKLAERMDALIATVEKLTPAFEKALDRQSVDVKERIADLKTDGGKTRDKLVDVEKDIARFEGSVRVFGKIYALALVIVAALLAWFLRPSPVPSAPPSPAATAAAEIEANTKNGAAEATPTPKGVDDDAP
jgi:hypothetical protein